VCAAIAATIAVNRENRKANQKRKKSTVKSVREEIKVKPVCKNYANKKKKGKTETTKLPPGLYSCVKSSHTKIVKIERVQ